MRKGFALLALILGFVAPAEAQMQEITIRSNVIETFLPGSDETRFGELEYVGGFSYLPSERRLRGVSSFRFRDGGEAFLAVTDTGLWFEGRIARDAGGRPTGIEDARIAPILNSEGEAPARKRDSDAEGLALDGSRAIISFEQTHRIEAFDADDVASSWPSSLPQPIPMHELRSNAALETLAVSPADGPLGGALVTVAEQSIDEAGNLFAAILGPGGGVFKVAREKPWHVTDGAFLPEGDLLLLERRYEGFGRVGMRVRRIDGATIAVGALVDGPVLVEADLSYEIDNMEGLDVHVGEGGETIVSIVSDDNGSFFQRNLYLEFRLVEDEGASG